MTLGLALSGGIAAGIANGGVLEVLDREDIQPDCIAGSSMGAIIGALYAFGIPIGQIHALARTLSLTNIADWVGPSWKDGLHGGLLRQRLEEHLQPLVGDATLADCRIPFTCIAGHVKEPIRWSRILHDGFTQHALNCIEPYVFPPDTRLLDALHATSAMPVLFRPAEVNGELFVDLLSFGAIPSRTLRTVFHPDLVIGTDTNPDWQDATRFLPRGWSEFIAAGYASLDESKAACDLVIKPAQPHQPFRFDQAEDFWQAGVRAAEERMVEIRKLARSESHQQ